MQLKNYNNNNGAMISLENHDIELVINKVEVTNTNITIPKYYLLNNVY